MFNFIRKLKTINSCLSHFRWSRKVKKKKKIEREKQFAQQDRDTQIRYTISLNWNFKKKKREKQKRGKKRKRGAKNAKGRRRRRKKERKGAEEKEISVLAPRTPCGKEMEFCQGWAALEMPPSILFRSQWHSAPTTRPASTLCFPFCRHRIKPA